MDALKYYVFKNSLTVHEQGPGMYHFSCLFDGESLSGLYSQHMNTFMFMSKPLNAVEAKALRELLRAEIEKRTVAEDLEYLEQVKKEVEEDLLREDKIRKEKERADKKKADKEKE